MAEDYAALSKTLNYLSHDSLITIAVRNNDVWLLAYYFKYVPGLEAEHQQALMSACHQNKIDVVKYLLDTYGVVTDEVVGVCVRETKIEILELFIMTKGLVLKDHYKMAGDYYCEDIHMTRFLLEHDVKADHCAIDFAAQKGVEHLKLFMEKGYDPPKLVLSWWPIDVKDYIKSIRENPIELSTSSCEEVKKVIQERSVDAKYWQSDN